MWSRGSSIEERVQARLQRLTREWSPTPLLEPPPSPAAQPAVSPSHDTPEESGVRWRYGRSAARGLAVLLLSVLVVAGWLWWQAQPRPITPTATIVDGGPVPGITSSGESTAAAGAEVIVHVVGSVHHPGLVRLPAGSRVAAAIEAAGGATDATALGTVNLARIVVDGEQIAVGVHADAAPGLSLNQATAVQLEELPGVGPVLAGRIISWREAHGPFRSIDELDEVPGIGAALMEQIRPGVRV